MESGGQCVMILLDKLMQMWHVVSWAMSQPYSMGQLVCLGKL